MENSSNQDNSHLEALQKKSSDIENKYGDEYPILVYEPAIKCQEKDIFKYVIDEIIAASNSILLFDQLNEVFNFAEGLGISFILITSSSIDEPTLIKESKCLKDTYCRQMFDFEEEALFKDLFKKNLPEVQESFKIKAFIFYTSLDSTSEVSLKEGEEEVMIMEDIKELAKKFRRENVIWFDPYHRSENQEILEKEVDIEEGNIYTDFQKLRKRIDEPNNSPYHLIMAGGDEAKQAINDILLFGNALLGLYIYSDDSEIVRAAEDYSKKLHEKAEKAFKDLTPEMIIEKGFKNLSPKVIIQKLFEDLTPKIIVQKLLKNLTPEIIKGLKIESQLKYNLPAFATSFDAFDKSHFYYLHYYLKGLINFQNRQQAKNDFLELSNRIYTSSKLKEFKNKYKEYNGDEIFKWYSMNSPIYKMINNCLRIATPDSILYCRFALKDLETAIREKHKKTIPQYNGLVYRGAFVSQDEWKKLKANIRKDIEMYGFISTSQDLGVAKKFFAGDHNNKILMTIIVPPLPLPGLDSQGFADISQTSSFKNQAEILFNVRSKFRILEAKEDAQIKFPDGEVIVCRHLVLLYGPQLLKRSMTLLQPQPSISVEIKLHQLLNCECGSKEQLFGLTQLESKLYCLKCLIQNEIPKDIPLLALNSKDIASGNREVSRQIKGKILKFDETVSFSFHGYECHNCQEVGKKTYYKWINSQTEKCYQQCDDCLISGREIDADILFAESNPYVLWQEYEQEWEKVDSDHQVELTEKVQKEGQDDVYLETQHFNSCIEYAKEVCCKLSRKRGREKTKLDKYDKCGRAYDRMGDHKAAIEFYQQALKISEVIYGGISHHTAISENNLAVVYQNLDDLPRAEIHLMKALNIIEVLYQKNHPYTVNAYNNLGSFYHKSGKYYKAFEHFAEAHTISKVIYAKHHPDVTLLYNNLASVCESLGNHQNAFKYYLEALDTSRAIYGEKHPKTASLYNNLASVYQSLGFYQQALICFQTAQDNIKGIYGERHPDIALYDHNIASIYNTLGKYREALEFNQKALILREKIYGEAHSQIVASYHNIAFVYKNLGKFAEAQESFQKCVTSFEKMYGKDHPHNAESLSHLASIYQSFGNYEQALRCHEETLRIRRTAFGEEHHQTATSYNNIGSVLQKLGGFAEAVEFHERALEIRKKLYGDNHPHTATSYNNLGFVYENLKDHEKAQKYFTEALNIKKIVYHEDHPLIATAYNNLGAVYESLGDHQQALKNFNVALEIRKKVYGEKHPDTAASFHNIGCTYASLGASKESVDCYRKALEICLEVFGEKHPQVAISYDHLAIRSQAFGDYEEALKNSEKSLNIRKNIFKNTHPDIALSWYHLGAAYSGLKKYEEALNCYKQALEIRKMVFGENHSQIALVYNSIGLVYRDLAKEVDPESNYLKAVSYLKKALKIWEANFNNNRVFLVTLYYNLGSVNSDMKKDRLALEFFIKSFNLGLNVYKGNYSALQETYCEFAQWYENLSDNELQTEYFQKILNLRQVLSCERTL